MTNGQSGVPRLILRNRPPQKPVIQPDEIGRVVMVRTSAWLLCHDEGPAFPTADEPPQRRSLDCEWLPPCRLLHTLTAAADGQAWLYDMGTPDGRSSGYLPPGVPQRALVDTLCQRITNVWLQPRSPGPRWASPQPESPPRTPYPEEQSRTGHPGPKPGRQWDPAELRHRVFLDSERFRALLGERVAGLGGAELTYYVLLDLRFFHLLGQLRCHVSMSIWSALPRHPDHRPQQIADDMPQRLWADVDAYDRLFTGVADAAEELLAERGFVRAELAIGDEAQGLPVFWAVLPYDRCLDPMGYLADDKLHRTTNYLAQVFLEVGDVRDTVVSRSVLNGQYLTLRRPKVREDGIAVPRYLLIPGGQPYVYDETPEQLELEMAVTVTTLTDLEATNASRLLAAKFDLEIWRNHLRVYDAVVERAAFLWDALSTHLPIRRGPELGMAHRAVELLHQMLLQGVADLGHITTLIREDTAKIAEVADDVSDEFHSVITEHHRSGESGLVAALTETGLAGYVQREAGETADEATRVKSAYEDLLGAIAHAFDERRVREVDAVQKSNFLLGAALGLVGLVSVLDATTYLHPEDGPPVTVFGGGTGWSQALVVASWLLGAVVIGVATVVLSRTVLIGRLGSPRFRSIYDGRAIRRRLGKRLPWVDPPWGVWHVLRDISTDALERLAKDPGEPVDWAEHDRRLAEEYAMIWDEVTGLSRPRRDHRASRDIRALSQQIEQWGMHALLLTERPRRMYRYPLPVLTCLLRASARIDGAFLGAAHLSRTNVVAYEDLTRSLARVGFTGDEIAEIDDWLTSPVYANATEALARINLLDLTPTMTSTDRRTALRSVRS